MPAQCTRFLLNLMNQCKLRFSVYVPYFAVGLGVVLIYYKYKNGSTNSNSSQPPNELNEAELQAPLKEEAAKEKIKMLDYINLGNSSLEMGSYEDAIEYYTKYLLLCPQSDRLLSAHVFHSRATAYYNMNLLKECLADCDKVLEFLPTNKDTLFLRARVLMGMKNLKLAAEDATVFLLTKDNMLHSNEDITYAFFVITAFDEETIQNFRDTKDSNLLLIKQIKEITNYKESFIDETLNAVDPKVLDKELIKTNIMASIKILSKFMDKYNADTKRCDPSDIIKLMHFIKLQLKAAIRLKLIHETN
ncbi:Tetratricopeptide repeat,Tetratricopeptide repeat-containing domain,Tetratricopeptide-like helical [Cinara cedri]|uniref:Tetratricopeptide repeat,Tetratricopeptide repeat-containing domain,Tetratricopeptide-like helical n=1 Tax=Cinara cedri TaxID=506608 RepID=A0A5E4NG63_9HEMI|nr:Tetratricopeptide repeat,Tetratricopeptide repeat-containing domain,Tetratricopeptide-like helical [Cinara cedri]